MKWGTLYTADYVNVLYQAVADHITGPFQFVCLTDDDTGLHPDIIAHPIPDFGFTARHFAAGAWPKLGVFAKDLYGLTGRALFIDLDMVIVDSLDPLFAFPGDVVCINSQLWNRRPGPVQTMTSIFAFDLGQQSHVIERFTADPAAALATYGNEQDFLHGEHGAISYWPDGWIISFKRDLRQPIGIDRFKGPKAPTPPTKVLAFHGDPRPIDLIRSPKGNWDKFPHYGKGQVPWMADYWTRYGGNL